MPRYFPEFEESDFDGLEPWVGLRPCTPDGLPYLGRPARWNNVVIATGHAMLGLSLGPISGQVVSKIIGGEKAPFDMELLSPDRFR